MSRLRERFNKLKTSGEKALILFVTAGDPTLKDLPDIAFALQEAGADVIEVGIPFTDPIADGPVIQAATQRALDRGVRPVEVLDAISKCKLEIPVVAMGYWNPILKMGPSRFAAEARASGLDGVIVSDIIPEESQLWIESARAADLDTIFLAAPTSTDARLEPICRVSTGFIYAVSRLGVTGRGALDSTLTHDLVSRLRSRTDLPICLGFGISSPESVRAACQIADGAIVGSWLVERLARDWQSPFERKELLSDVRALKDATRA